MLDLECDEFVNEFGEVMKEDKHTHNSYDCWGEQ